MNNPLKNSSAGKSRFWDLPELFDKFS